jgi:hypothetical protein
VLQQTNNGITVAAGTFNPADTIQVVATQGSGETISDEQRSDIRMVRLWCDNCEIITTLLITDCFTTTLCCNNLNCISRIENRTMRILRYGKMVILISRLIIHQGI